MARKKGLKNYSERELVEELARRHADREFRDGMTMTDIELAAENLKEETGGPSIALMLSRTKREKATPKACPRCGKRTPVKARDRERTVCSLSGPITFKRNYHYCEGCKYGFYPVDRLLDLPEEGELTAEMEKRVLDFAVNDVYGEAVERWSLHYCDPISDNLLRRVAARIGEQCETADQGRLQEYLSRALRRRRCSWCRPTAACCRFAATSRGRKPRWASCIDTTSRNAFLRPAALATCL